MNICKYVHLVSFRQQDEFNHITFLNDEKQLNTRGSLDDIQ